MKFKIFIICLLCCFCSCFSNKNNNNSNDDNYSIFNENLITANKYLVKQDKELIEKYIKRRNWNMDTTEDGVRYMIIKEGNGETIENQPSITLNYRIELLDGTVCYDSEVDGKQNLIAGSSEMLSGLIKAFKVLRHGDEAVLILPPHFAKGLVGDLNKIPPHSVIVYFLKIE